ncbi:hypothetical protein [Lacinutrix sp. Bg11-31]|uniref:hypothetical protein n=1 Tax=Lacinutrix sp. Bg11-31 TaxID=2057808 RepID=UPI000C308478|nr:hypothetical protein [Lacinutrix sp. Bg11-31]AUC82237.1 hypothetical protein CW733_08895 [Lacinutrix sp. Bg11-31]
MENTNAIKVIDKILNNLDKSGINTDTLIDDIKALRVFAIEEEVPLVVKVLRLAYEHIEEHEAFLLPIPQDEPLEEDGEEEPTVEDNEVSPIESLKYLIALTRNLNNKDNISDLKEYKELLLAY